MGVIEKLNEWHFADYCLRSVQEKGRAVFNIVRRDRHPQFTFTGILRDRKGNIYEITGDESGNLRCNKKSLSLSIANMRLRDSTQQN